MVIGPRYVPVFAVPEMSVAVVDPAASVSGSATSGPRAGSLIAARQVK